MSSEDPLAAADPAQIKLDCDDGDVANAVDATDATPATDAAPASPPAAAATAAAAAADTSAGRSASPADRNSSMRTEVPTGTWLEQWNATGAKIKITNPDLIIKVTSPELISSFMSKYVVYTVKTDPLGYAVRRRYNDFQWLRDVLIAKYTGLYVPMLPATKGQITGKTDINGTYIKNRMAQLNLFVQQVNKIPFLRTDPNWISFLSIQTDKDFEALTKTPVSSELSSDTSAGYVAWNNMLERNMVTGDADRTVKDVWRQLDVLTKTLTQIDKDCRNTGNKALQCSRAMDSLSISIDMWNTTEHELLDPVRNEFVNSNGDKIKLHMGSVVDSGNQLSLNLSMIPKIIARVLISGVQFQLQQVEGFRQHLSARDKALKELDAAEKARLTALSDKQRAQAAGTSPKRGSVTSLFVKKTDELEEDLRKKTEKVKSLEDVCTNMTKAIMFCEIARFNNERAQSTAYLLGSLAATNLQISQAGMSKWSEIMQQSGMDINAEDFNAVLNSALDDGDAVFGDV